MKLDTNQSICIIVVPATGKYQLPIIILTGTTLCVLMIKGEVTGYFSYHINWITKSIDSLGLISFINNNIILINDVIKHLIYLLDHVGINRIEFWAYADNPAVDGYEKLVKKIQQEKNQKDTEKNKDTKKDDKTKDNQTDQNETQKEQAADPGQADQTQENQPTDQIQENQPTTAENNQ